MSDLVLAVQVWKRVVHADDSVKIPLRNEGQIQQVRNESLNIQPSLGGFCTHSLDSGRAEIARGNSVSAASQPKCLRSDATGTIENPKFGFRKLAFQDRPQDSCLTLDGGFPIFEYQVIVVSKFVVEGLHPFGHASFYCA